MNRYRPFIQPLFERYWRMSLLGLILGLITSLSGMSLLAASGWFISATGVAGLSHVALNTGLPSAGIRALALTRIISRYYDLMVSHRVIFCLLADLRVWVYQKCLPLAPFHLSLFSSSDLLNRMMSDINTLDGFYLRVIQPLITALVIASLATFIFLPLSMSLTLFFLSICLLSFIIIPYLFSRLTQRVGQRLVLAQAALREIFIVSIQGLATLIALGQVLNFKKNMVNAQTQLSQAQTALNQLEACSLALFQLFAGALLLFTLWLGPALTAQLHSGVLFALLVLGVIGITTIFLDLPLGLQSLGKIRFAADRLLQIADTKSPVSFPKQSIRVPSHLDLHFKAVHFSYPHSCFSILNNFTTTFKWGEHIALVGPSGIGKSTLAYLGLRFLNPSQGQILLGETPIEDLSEADLRSMIHLVPQEPYLFQNSIRYNLLLGKPQASEDELWQALAQAELKHEIEQLPLQLDTWIGEQGLQLSGGQQKRLALARSLLYKAPILILDEPTEGLDADTATRLLQNITQLYHGSTLCVISHHIPDLKYLDRIVSF